ncbi:MAG TPA: hypothetical protein PKM41_07015 [Deltaproteobacteria bacterium]|jgi:hypothetical protein|nr:hypothetical protein [Deltaproteobacteria bacterium]HOI06859.1 hypothetical protein [Deltaproteobacteria bacterium]
MSIPYRAHVNRALLVLVLWVAAGCATMPERITVSVSPFDGARETALEPAPVCSRKSGQACPIRMGLYKRSTMSDESVILIVVAETSSPIADGESLLFRVNGRVRGFASIDRSTRYSIGTGPHTAGSSPCRTRHCSVRRYLVDRAFLKELVAAPGASVRVLLKSGSVDGTLSDNDPELALPSFREFYTAVFGHM